MIDAFLKSLAPTVASALLGPLGGVAVSGLGKILGLDGATVKDVTKAITDGQITPDQIAEIRKLELQYKADEAARGFKYSELEFADTRSAREMQIATESRVPAVLAAIITIGFFGILIYMISSVDYKPTDSLLLLLGSLSTAWTMVVGFYFGSSHGSREKSRLLAEKTPEKV